MAGDPTLPAPLPLNSGQQPAVTSDRAPVVVQSPQTAPQTDSGDPKLPTPLTAGTPDAAAGQPEHGYWWNAARTFGNQAIIPHTLDRILASGPGGSGDIDKEVAISKKAEDQLGLSGSFIPKLAGQELTLANLSRFVPYVGRVTDNPIAQGTLTEGLGTIIRGDFNPYDIAAESAKASAGYAAGGLVGKYGGDVVKSLTGTSFGDLSKQAQDAVDAAFLANSPNWGKAVANKIGIDNLADLHGLYQRGGDVAARAEELAQSAGGAAKTAYQNIAQAANKATDPGMYAAAAGVAAAHLGDWGASVWPAVQRVAKYVNQGTKGVDIRNAIDQAAPAVSGFVRSNINPEHWGSVLAPAGLSAANQVYQKGVDLFRSGPW